MNAIFDGIVRTGLGTGASYVALPYFFDHFVKFLGAAPFPGTLNIQLSKASIPRFRTAIEKERPMVIPSHRADGRSLWRVLCYCISLWRADRGNEQDGERGLALEFDRPEHPKDIVEVVSLVHLRKRFGLVDGDRIHFRFDADVN